MNHILTLSTIIGLFLVLSTCSSSPQDAAEPKMDDARLLQLQEQQEFIVSIATEFREENSFLEHFPTTVKFSEVKRESEKELRPGGKVFYLLDLAGPHNPTELLVNYRIAKPRFEAFMETPADQVRNHTLLAVQIAGQKFMRKLFLKPEYEKENLSEINFLFETLVKAGSIDLDVLVDGYQALAFKLTPQEKQMYLDYLQKVHDDLIDKIGNRVEDFEDDPDLLDPKNPDQLGNLMHVGYYVKLSRSCKYYRDKMGIRAPKN